MNTDKTHNQWAEGWEKAYAEMVAITRMTPVDLRSQQARLKVDRVCYYGKEDGEPR